MGIEKVATGMSSNIKAGYVCDIKEKKAGSKKRKVGSLWIASLCKQEEKD